MWRKSLVISSPASVPKAGSPGASCKGLCAVIFLSSSKDGDFTISLRNMLHCSITFTPQTSVFLTFLWNSLLFSSCPLTLGLSLTRVWLCLLYTLPHQGSIHAGGSLLSLPFSRNSPSSPSLSWSIWQTFPVL